MIPKEEMDKIIKVTEKAINVGYAHADVEWKKMALEKVYEVARKMEEFTANDVREAVRSSHLKTHDNRAMGGVMVTARVFGWIRTTGRTIPSLVGHLTRLAIWESLLCEPAPYGQGDEEDVEITGIEGMNRKSVRP